jgi:hypothetical protein
MQAAGGSSLNDMHPEKRLYFADFGDDCALREIITGPLSDAEAQTR